MLWGRRHLSISTLASGRVLKSPNVQQLVPEFAVKALLITVLPRVSRFDEQGLCTDLVIHSPMAMDANSGPSQYSFEFAYIPLNVDAFKRGAFTYQQRPPSSQILSCETQSVHNTSAARTSCCRVVPLVFQRFWNARDFQRLRGVFASLVVFSNRWVCQPYETRLSTFDDRACSRG